MNRNSEIIAIGSIGLLVIIIGITMLMTAKHFEWIETNLMGGNIIKCEKSPSLDEIVKSYIDLRTTANSGEPISVLTPNNTWTAKVFPNEIVGISILTDDGDGTNIEVLIVDKKAEVFGIAYNDSSGVSVTLTMPADKMISYEEMLKIWEKAETNIKVEFKLSKE